MSGLEAMPRERPMPQLRQSLRPNPVRRSPEEYRPIEVRERLFSMERHYRSVSRLDWFRWLGFGSPLAMNRRSHRLTL